MVQPNQLQGHESTEPWQAIGPKRRSGAQPLLRMLYTEVLTRKVLSRETQVQAEMPTRSKVCDLAALEAEGPSVR